MLFEYPVYNADIGTKGFQVVSLGADVEGYDQSGLARVQAQIHVRAAEEAVELLTNPEERQKAVEQNFQLGQKYYSMDALRDILGKLMSD